MLLEIKFLTYPVVHEFDVVLKKTNHQLNERDVMNPSNLDPNNFIDEDKIEVVGMI